MIKKSDDLLAIIKKYYYNEKASPERPNDDLGYVPVSILPESFVRVLKHLKTGAISKPIHSDQGYHFLQLLDWKKAGTLRNLELVKNQITVRLKKERRETERIRVIKDAKSNAQIQTYLSKIQE